MRVLILGGTTESSALAGALAGDRRWDATLSLAGRTRAPAPQPIACRIGGFGGVEGLAAYLRSERIEAVIDATHPFAAQISRHAVAAAGATGVRLLGVLRPEWRRAPGDRWTEVADMTEAAASLGTARRVFLTVGQGDLGPFLPLRGRMFLLRSVDPPPRVPEGATVITARGPFAEADERQLMEIYGVEMLVTKNSGGMATRGKIDAARSLGIPIVMVRRPEPPAGMEHVDNAAAALDWLRRHAETRRGE